MQIKNHYSNSKSAVQDTGGSFHLLTLMAQEQSIQEITYTSHLFSETVEH